jgi:hypothetical protein
MILVERKAGRDPHFVEPVSADAVFCAQISELQPSQKPIVRSFW